MAHASALGGLSARDLRRPRVALALALACAGCHTPAAPADCAVAPPPAPAPAPAVECSPRLADEWARTSADAPELLPVRVELSRDGRLARLVVLFGPPEPRRITFAYGLEDGALTPIGYEPLGGEWYARRRAELSASPGLDRLMACAALPDGRQLRLLPSRLGGADHCDARAHWYDGALRVRGAGATEDRALWSPTHDSAGDHCRRRMIVLQDGRRYTQCVDSRECTPRCPDVLPGFVPQFCTGQTQSGFVYCEFDEDFDPYP